jgi:hypothetical protein
MGRFLLGSTVVMLFPRQALEASTRNGRRQRAIRMGEAMGVAHQPERRLGGLNPGRGTRLLVHWVEWATDCSSPSAGCCPLLTKHIHFNPHLY